MTVDQYQGNLNYAVDIVLCIDATASMGPTLDRVKKTALSFHERLAATMEEKRKAISQLRLRVVAFRDFGHNPDDALMTTEFLSFPEHAGDFEDFVMGLEPVGGGDYPESGLEALSVAVQSDWERGLDRRRHVIVLFTDASAHPLGTPAQIRAQTYPPSVPRSMDELFEQWGDAGGQAARMESSAKRLLVFAPEEFPWTDISDDWTNTLFFPSEAGEGLEEWEMTEIINTIANSI